MCNFTGIYCFIENSKIMNMAEYIFTSRVNIVSMIENDREHDGHDDDNSKDY